MELVNVTPHTLKIHLINREILELPPAGPVARVETTVQRWSPDGKLRFAREIVGDVSGLPEPKDGVLYVVSRLVADVVEREDVVYPTDFIREDGRVVGAKALGVNY